MLAVNVGHRDYGYKSALLQHIPYTQSIAADRPYIKRNVGKYLLIAGGVVLAYLILDPSLVEAASPLIDTSPIDKLTSVLYDALRKVSLYIATPLLAWSGITLATSGTNTGRRTMAKEVGKWTVVGLGVIVGAPWLATMIFKLWVGIF